MKHIRQTSSFYNAAQVQAYMERIEFPSSDLSSFRANVTNLEQLIRLHLVAFPFEISQLHYSAAHVMDVSTQSVYNRLVVAREGGSWCCGQNGLFLGMLRGLGYRAYAAAGRVNKSPPTAKEPTDYTFLTHMVLFVQIGDEPPETGDASIARNPSHEEPEDVTYLVDVGFGRNGLVRPIRLEVDQIVSGSAPPEEHRLIRGKHPKACVDEDYWLLQYRCGSYQPDWGVLFQFGESETFPEDWVALSQWLSQHPVALFANNMVCVRHFVLEGQTPTEEGDTDRNPALGRLVMMGGKVQRRVGDQSETIREISTETERIRICREDFGVTVSEGDIHNIFHSNARLSDY